MNLNFVCTCGHRFPSDLNRWGEFNAASGEIWQEKCSACGAIWSVQATTEIVSHHQRTGAPKCACGKTMERTTYSNSGSTYISHACPVLVDLWGTDRHVWREPLPPHQFEVKTTSEHALTGCCNIRKIETYP